MHRRAVTFGEGRSRQEDSEVVDLIGVLEQEDEVRLVAGVSYLCRARNSLHLLEVCLPVVSWSTSFQLEESGHLHQSTGDNGSEHDVTRSGESSQEEEDD